MEAKQNEQDLAKLRESATDPTTDPADRRAAADLLAEAGAIADAVPALITAGRDLMDAGDVELGPGDLFVIPRGVHHQPVSRDGAEVMLIEPGATVNTGDTPSGFTRAPIVLTPPGRPEG